MAAAVLAACAATAGARVIGHTVAGPPLTEERIRQTLPAAGQRPWLAYLRRSRAQMQADQAALLAERTGMDGLPPLPPSSPSARSMPLNRDDAWYGSPEAQHVAAVIVSFQTPAGGWGKNLDMAAAERVRGQSYVGNNENRFSAPGDLDQPRDAAWHYVGTLDNDATTTEIRFLVRAAAHAPATQATTLQASALRGIRYLLRAQYPNGGWPQVWPLEGGYHDAITFNDDAVRNAMEVLHAASADDAGYSFVPAELREAARRAVAAGVHCILRSQVVLDGRRTIWGQQHDPLTLQPVGARNFEPASLASQESGTLLDLLQTEPQPDAATREAIAGGVSWLRAHAIRDVAVVGGRDTTEGRHTVAQAGAGPLWSRFYSLGVPVDGAPAGTPIFGDRDRTIHDQMNDLSAERRNGYAWYTAAPAAILR